MKIRLRFFGEVNFEIIANRDVGNFVHFWQFFALVFTFQLILSYRLQRKCSLDQTFFINDMPQGIDPCTNLALYADDTKIWRKIVNSRDIALLQKDRLFTSVVDKQYDEFPP